jgi:hypothetical protein
LFYPQTHFEFFAIGLAILFGDVREQRVVVAATAREPCYRNRE